MAKVVHVDMLGGPQHLSLRDVAPQQPGPGEVEAPLANAMEAVLALGRRQACVGEPALEVVLKPRALTMEHETADLGWREALGHGSRRLALTTTVRGEPACRMATSPAWWAVAA